MANVGSLNRLIMFFVAYNACTSTLQEPYINSYLPDTKRSKSVKFLIKTMDVMRDI